MRTRHCLSAGLLASIVLIAPGCGGSSESTSAPVSSGAASPADTTFNEADTAFTHAMIGHHEQAVEMAALALDPQKGARPEIVDLATRIQAGQQPEIERMTGWLDAWGEPHDDDSMAGMDHSQMGGMTSEEEMSALAAMTGSEFDTTWLTLMIAHHRGAISDALVVQRDGMNADVRELATAIVAAQNEEIAEMTELLG